MKKLTIFFNKVSVQSAIYKKSPYYQRYHGRYLKIKELRDEAENALDRSLNVLYAPEFFKYLLNRYMAFLQLWTGILMDLIDPRISRVTSSYVECHMKTYKKEILLNTKNWSIADVIRKLETNVECLIAKEEIYKISQAENENLKYPLYKDPAADPKIKSEWAKTWKGKEENK